MTHRRNHRSPKGFTVIEILGVMAILAVLLAIAVLGFRGMQTSSANRKTKVMLGNAASILTEYDATTGLKTQPPYMWNGTPAKVTTGFDVWKDAVPATADHQSVPSPGKVDPDSQARTTSQAVLNTAVVLREAGRGANAKAMIGGLPPDELLQIREPGGPTPPPPAIGPVLLDGWGNPIIFVPAAGLADVALADQPVTYVVRSNKVYRSNDTSLTGVLPPDARPFFASAGPDGIFGYVDTNNNGTFNPGVDVSGGDDNVYSFQN